MHHNSQVDYSSDFFLCLRQISIFFFDEKCLSSIILLGSYSARPDCFGEKKSSHSLHEFTEYVRFHRFALQGAFFECRICAYVCMCLSLFFFFFLESTEAKVTKFYGYNGGKIADRIGNHLVTQITLTKFNHYRFPGWLLITIRSTDTPT